MAQEFPVQLNSILDGEQSNEYTGTANQFLASIGIDPDLSVNPNNEATTKAGGVITPSLYAKFSSTAVTSYPIAIITNPQLQNDLVYVVLKNGRLISYSQSLGSETLVATAAGGNAEGAFYYNNYIYITGTGASKDDVSRFGPLDAVVGSRALTDSVWTGATLGSQTALTDTDYPSARSADYLNHWGHVHSDGAAYFLDYKDGQGLVHTIKTTKGTDEGDTDDGSAYNVLDLPFGYLPTDIESYGTDLIISATRTRDNTLNQGTSALFIWDPTDVDSFYRQVDLDEPLASALLNRNGSIYVFSGTVANGYSVGVYDGAFGVRKIAFFEHGNTPFAGAVTNLNNRVVWGTYMTDPEDAGVIKSLGYKNPRLSDTAIHTIVRSTAGSSDGIVTAVNDIQQSSGSNPKVVLGHRNGSAQFGLDKQDATATQDSIIRTRYINVGQPFTIKKIRIPLTRDVGSGTIITPKIFYDDKDDSKTLATINNTNYSGKRNILYKNVEINGTATTGLDPQHNFFMEFAFTGTRFGSIKFPIEFVIETRDD